MLNYLSFLTLGLGSGAIGPSLPTLADQMDVGLDAAGGLVSSLFVGYLIAGLTAGPLTDTVGRRLVYLAALGVQTLSLLAIVAIPSLTAGLLVAFLLGLGQGSIDVASHVVTGDVVGKERGAALNRLHLFFGVGALLGPVMAGYALDTLDSLWPVFIPTAALTLLIALGIALTPLPTLSPSKKSAATNVRAVVGSHAVWALAAFIFLYVGVEVGIGTWTFAFLSEGLGTGIRLASWAASSFYLALTAGRLVGSKLAGRKVTDEKLVLLSVGGGVIGAALLWIAGASAAVPTFFIAVLLLGFCFGPIYPTTMGVAQQRYPEAIGTIVGLITVGAGLGAMFFPWLQGWLLTHGGLMWGVGITSVGALALLAIAAIAIPQHAQK